MKKLPKGRLFDMEHEAPESESDRRKRRILGLWLILLPLVCWAALLVVESFRPNPSFNYAEFFEVRPLWWTQTINSLAVAGWLCLPTAVSGILLYLRRVRRFSVFLASFLTWGFCGAFFVSGVLGNLSAYASPDFSLMQGLILGFGSLAAIILASCVFCLEYTGMALMGFLFSPLASVLNFAAAPFALMALVAIAYNER